MPLGGRSAGIPGKRFPARGTEAIPTATVTTTTTTGSGDVNGSGGDGGRSVAIKRLGVVAKAVAATVPTADRSGAARSSRKDMKNGKRVRPQGP